MKAIVQDGYGPADQVLHLRDVPKPKVGDHEVLVRVRAASVHPDVWHVVTGRPFVLRLMGAGLRRPNDTIPGTDLAGTVEEVGREVTAFVPGDHVFGEPQWRNGGTFADYVSVPQDQAIPGWRRFLQNARGRYRTATQGTASPGLESRGTAAAGGVSPNLPAPLASDSTWLEPPARVDLSTPYSTSGEFIPELLQSGEDHLETELELMPEIVPRFQHTSRPPSN